MKISQRLQNLFGILLILIGVGFLTPQGNALAHATTTFLGLTDSPASYASRASRAVVVNAGATALDFADSVYITETYVRAQNVQAEYPAGTSALAFRFFHTGAPSAGDKVMYDLGIYSDDEDMFFRGYDGSDYQYFFKTDWDTGNMTLEAGDVDVTAGSLTAEDLISDDDLTVADDATISGDLSAYSLTSTGNLSVGNDATVSHELTVNGSTLLRGGSVDGDFAVFDDLTVTGGDFQTYAGSALIGQYAASDNTHALVHASGRFAATGDAQGEQHIVMRSVQLNGAGTWYDLYGTGILYRVEIPADTLWQFRILVAITDEGVSNSAGYEIFGTLENDNGTTTLKTSTVNVVYEDDATWDVQVVADDGNDALLVQICDTDGPGSGGDEVRAVAGIVIASVSYPAP